MRGQSKRICRMPIGFLGKPYRVGHRIQRVPIGFH